MFGDLCLSLISTRLIFNLNCLGFTTWPLIRTFAVYILIKSLLSGFECISGSSFFIFFISSFHSRIRSNTNQPQHCPIPLPHYHLTGSQNLLPFQNLLGDSKHSDSIR
ncbi:unnamed protein product [Prunus armeniaca]